MKKDDRERWREYPSPTTMRLPPELREQLLKAAKTNGVSLSAEMIARLTASLKKPK